MDRAQRQERTALAPALGMVFGSTVALVAVVAFDATGHLALAMVGGAAIGFVIGLVLQLRPPRR